MREFTGAFLGTLAAVLFVVGLVAFLVYRESLKVDAGIKREREPELEREPEQPVAAPREAVHPSQVPS